MVRSLMFFCLFMLPLFAAAAAEQLSPGAAYYFDSFDPGQRPWAPGRPLNIEEVFKNYQYYEIVLGPDGKEMTVSRYVRGSKSDSVRYTLMPDGALRENVP